MTLKEKVFFYRNKYRREKIFEINNPDIQHYKYFGLFEDNQGDFHYDSDNEYQRISHLKKERIEQKISKNYIILNRDDFCKLWFDIEFWNYAILQAKTKLEEYHCRRKLELLKEKIFF